MDTTLAVFVAPPEADIPALYFLIDSQLSIALIAEASTAKPLLAAVQLVFSLLQIVTGTTTTIILIIVSISLLKSTFPILSQAKLLILPIVLPAVQTFRGMFILLTPHF